MKKKDTPRAPQKARLWNRRVLERMRDALRRAGVWEQMPGWMRKAAILEAMLKGEEAVNLKEYLERNGGDVFSARVVYIIPLIHFDLSRESHRSAAFHYTNLRLDTDGSADDRAWRERFPAVSAAISPRSPKAAVAPPLAIA